MIFVSSFSEKYVGKPFDIDCVDIEIHGFQDNQPPIFKGPGVIHGDKTGRLAYKIYNQIPVNKEIFECLKRIEESDDPKQTNVRLLAEAYDGTKWSGGWSIPKTTTYSGTAYFLVHGEFDELGTSVVKQQGDTIQDTTELVFVDLPELPFAGTMEVKSFHGEEVIETSFLSDHHHLTFEDTTITFQESLDKSRLHVEAHHGSQFTPPYVENWLAEALVFSTARSIQPRMVIRHFEEYALVSIRATPNSTVSGMIPPFSSAPDTRDAFWQSFCAYLSTCKATHEFENLKMTTGFRELCLANKGTLQGSLLSLSIYIEFCMNQLLPSVQSENAEVIDKARVKDFLGYVNAWSKDTAITERAIRILNQLNTPDLAAIMDVLIEKSVITEKHKKVWKAIRPTLAHGKLIDYREEKFWHFRNYLITMMYRLMFRIIGYKGLVLEYDGSKFQYIPYEWKE